MIQTTEGGGSFRLAPPSRTAGEERRPAAAKSSDGDAPPRVSLEGDDLKRRRDCASDSRDGGGKRRPEPRRNESHTPVALSCHEIRDVMEGKKLQ